MGAEGGGAVNEKIPKGMLRWPGDATPARVSISTEVPELSTPKSWKVWGSRRATSLAVIIMYEPIAAGALRVSVT